MNGFYINDPDNPQPEVEAISMEVVPGTSFAFQFENGIISHRMRIPVLFA